MSCVRYFNGIPHVVRYGMHDDKKGISWMKFWRNGTGFQIDVDRKDVLGTRFEKKWSDLLSREHNPDRRRTFVHDWEMLCDCILSQCLDLLEDMAPDRHEFWSTFREYLHTPMYKIKVIKDEDSNEAKGVVTDGPEWDGAYELAPLPVKRIGFEIEEHERYRSEDLVVVDKEVNWRTPPHRVRTIDGECFALRHVDVFSKMVNTGEILNDSLDQIKKYLRIHKQCETLPGGYPDRIPRIFGYVTDDTIPSEKRPKGKPAVVEDDDDDDDKDINAEGGLETVSDNQPRTLVAGLLLTDFPHFRSLHDIVRDAKTDGKLLTEIKKNQEHWKAQTLAVVQELHVRGMACGGSEETGWLYINQVLAHIDNEQKVWLDPLVKHFVSMDNDAGSESDTISAFEKAKELDLKGIEKIYEEWLPDQLKKIEDQTKEA